MAEPDHAGIDATRNNQGATIYSGHANRSESTRQDPAIEIQGSGMFHRRVGKAAKRMIWRMSLKHPKGVYLAIFRREASSADSVELQEHCYRASSFDLSTGAQVVETTMDTLPIELIDAFAKARR